MKTLFTIDLHDYEDYYAVSKRPSARGIILKNNKIALVYSKKEKYYKFPGGGIDDTEDAIAALVREVREEAGLIVKPESITEYGCVYRRQKSNMFPDTIFQQENYYYFCDVEDQIFDQKLDDYELEEEFTLTFVDIDTAIAVNENYHSENEFKEKMIQREVRVLHLLKDQLADIHTEP